MILFTSGKTDRLNELLDAIGQIAQEAINEANSFDHVCSFMLRKKAVAVQRLLETARNELRQIDEELTERRGS